MKNKMKRMTALLLSIVMLLSSVVLTAAEEQNNSITAETLGQELVNRYGGQMTDQEKALLTSGILAQPNLEPAIDKVSVDYEKGTVTAEPYPYEDNDFCWEPVSLTVDGESIELDESHTADITIPFQTLTVQYQLTVTMEQQDRYLQELKHLKEMLSYVEDAKKGAEVLQFLLDQKVRVDLDEKGKNTLVSISPADFNKLKDCVQLKVLWQKYCAGEVCNYVPYGTLNKATNSYEVNDKILYNVKKIDAADLANKLVEAAMGDGLPSYCSYQHVADTVDVLFGETMQELYRLAVVAYNIDQTFIPKTIIDYQLKQKITSEQMNKVGATSTDATSVYEKIIEKISLAAEYHRDHRECFVPLADGADTTLLDRIVNAAPVPTSLRWISSTTDLYRTAEVTVDSEKHIVSWGSLLATLYDGNDAAKEILNSPALKTGYRKLHTPTDESLVTVTAAGEQYTVTAQNFTDGDGLTWLPAKVTAKKDGNETATSGFTNNTATVSVSAGDYDTMDVTYEVTLGYPDAIDAGAILALPQTLKDETEEQLQVMEDMSGNGMVTNLEKVQRLFDKIYNIVYAEGNGADTSITALDEIRNQCTYKGTYTEHDASGNVVMEDGKPSIKNGDIFYLYDHVIAYRKLGNNAQRLAYYYAHCKEILPQLKILQEKLPVIAKDRHIDELLDLFGEGARLNEIDELIDEFNNAYKNMCDAAPSTYIDPKAEKGTLEALAAAVLGYPNEATVPNKGDHLCLTAVISVEKSLLSIELNQKPTTVRYRKGESKPGVTGGTITLHYQDGTSRVISLTGEMLSGFDPDRTGEQDLTVTYREKTCTFPMAVTIVGDVNGDGEITKEDAGELAGHIAKIKPLTNQAAADVDGDGEPTAKDLTELARMLLQ